MSPTAAGISPPHHPKATLALGFRGRKVEEGGEQVEIGVAGLAAEFGEQRRRSDGDIALQIALTRSLCDEELHRQGCGFATGLQAVGCRKVT
jgi:hypothetical protein